MNIGCPSVLLPAKVVQALSLSFEEMNGGHSHPRFGCGFSPDQGMSLTVCVFWVFLSFFPLYSFLT